MMFCYLMWIRTTGLLTITPQQYANLQSLYFKIGGVSFAESYDESLINLLEQVTYDFTPNAQIWPRSLNSILGGDPSKIYLIVSDLGSSFGTGLDFISTS
jgi:hypothetical protein